MRDAMAVLICEINRDHHLAVNIEPTLLVSCFPDAYWPLILIPTQMIERNLVELLPAIEPIHDLQWTPLGVVAQPSFQPFDECFCFFDEPQSNKGVEGERRISQPGEAIIPVAHAPNTLG